MSECTKLPHGLSVAAQPALRTVKSERTRAGILDAAFEFIWSRRYRELTVNTLMLAAGCSRPVFYQYFRDLNDLMETLLSTLEDEILVVVGPWLSGEGEPAGLLHASLGGLVDVCHARGPFIRAVVDAAAANERLDQAWNDFLGRFDAAVAARIAADQRQQLIADFDPHPVAVSLNRLNAYTFIDAFGQHPRRDPGPVCGALSRIWTATLYGTEYEPAGESAEPRVRRRP